MARNAGRGGGRVRAVKDPSRLRNGGGARTTARDTQTGRFVEAKKAGDFKGVRREG
jgi:hypothetical protein